MTENTRKGINNSAAGTDTGACLCLNCQTLLLDEKDKVTKIVRKVGEIGKEKDVEVSVTIPEVLASFNLPFGSFEEGDEDLHPLQLCVGCGHLLETAYNAVEDFKRLMKKKFQLVSSDREFGSRKKSPVKAKMKTKKPSIIVIGGNEASSIVAESGNNDADEGPAQAPAAAGTAKGRKLDYECGICGKLFHRQDHCQLHRRTHTGEKPYSCELCGKKFSDPRGLSFHEITHSNERPYCCTVCGQTFKRRHHLNDHEKNHHSTLPRPFNCIVCGKSFKHKKHLNSHAVIHSMRKEHQCSTCNRSFNRKDNLRQHIRKVHESIKGRRRKNSQRKGMEGETVKFNDNDNKLTVSSSVNIDESTPTSTTAVFVATTTATTTATAFVQVPAAGTTAHQHLDQIVYLHL